MELNISGLNRYAFLDPASGRQTIKRTRARSAIVVIGVDSLNRIFVLETWAERAATTKIIEQVLVLNNRWQPKLFGCESNAQQSLFADVLNDTGKRQVIGGGRKLPLTAVFQPTKVDKDFRIRSAIQPVIADGRLFVPARLTEMRLEIQAFPMGGTKDLIDALASAIGLVPFRPVKQMRDDEAKALSAYLRKCGTPAWAIEQKLREMGAAA